MKVTAEFDERDLGPLREILRQAQSTALFAGPSERFDYKQTESILRNVIAQLESSPGSGVTP